MWIKIVKYKKLSFSYRKVGWSRSDMKRRSRDCAFYPDKKKGPGALETAGNFAALVEQPDTSEIKCRL